MNYLTSELQKNMCLNGKLLGQNNFLFRKAEILEDIKKAEFKVFSQWGDDGIIDFLVNYLDIENKLFVEFGVENYTECNTKFLLINNNWSGLIMDGSKENMKEVTCSDISWKYDLQAETHFITKENINELLISKNIIGEIGLLHIDIDGNDFWIWNEIDVIEPVIVIVEYNSLFGPHVTWTTPYKSDFVRSRHHFSNILYGASLTSLYDLALQKGYSFIGSNSNGNNAYFVKTSRLKELTPKTVEEGYVESKFKEARNENGSLSYLSGSERLNLLRGQIIYNTRTQGIEVI